MNKLESKADWNILRGKIKQRWAKLTDDDLQFSKSKEAELMGRIQKRNRDARAAMEHALHESATAVTSFRQ